MTKLAEEHFLVCLKHSTWGSNASRFGPWRLGDGLAFLVETNIAGLAEVAGSPYLDDAPIWNNGLFPYRVPIRFLRAIRSENRPSVLGPISQALRSLNSRGNYGSYIASLAVLPEHATRLVLETIESHPNDLLHIYEEVDSLIFEARAARK